MTRTVAHVLSNADDSVALINDVNTNGSSSEYISNEVNQDEINALVQRNVNHLELILAFDGTNETPDVAGSSEDKSSYTDAIATGKAYIAAN
jgi:hypothetical protein